MIRPLTKTRSGHAGGRPFVESHTGPEAPSAVISRSVGEPPPPPPPPPFPPQDASTNGISRTATVQATVGERFTSLMETGSLPGAVEENRQRGGVQSHS